MADYILLQDGSGQITLQDASGQILLQSDGAVAGGPFGPTNWPNPLGPQQRSRSLLTWTQSLLQSTLAPAAQAPFNQTNWPNPRGRARANELLTWLLHLNQSTLAPVAVVFRAPLITRYERRGFLRAILSQIPLGLLQTTLTPVAVDPFFNRDWPNPRGATRANELLTWLQRLQIPEPTQDPFRLTDWPNPRGPVGVVDLRTWLIDLLQSTLAPAAQAPFNLTNWPNPQRLTARDYALLVNLLESTLAPAQASPFNLTNWPNPLQPARLRDYTLLINLLQSTLTPGVVVVPFHMLDWPNPRGPLNVVALRTLIQLIQPPAPAPGVDMLIRMLRGVGL